MRPVMWAWDIVNFVWWIGIFLPCGNTDFGDPFSPAATLANGCESRSRGHDDLCGDVRGHFSRDARWPCMV